MATTRTRRLARQVSIVGAGLSQFGAYPDKSSRDLFVEAFHDMQDNMDQGISAQDIEAGYIGNYSADLFEHQGHTAPIIADWLGMTPTPITRIENACASSGSAYCEWTGCRAGLPTLPIVPAPDPARPRSPCGRPR